MKTKDFLECLKVLEEIKHLYAKWKERQGDSIKGFRKDLEVKKISDYLKTSCCEDFSSSNS